MSSQSDYEEDTKNNTKKAKPSAPAAGGDIRNFFGGSSQGSFKSPTVKTKASAPPKAKPLARKNETIELLDDSSEEDVKPGVHSKPTTSGHFASSSKSFAKRNTVDDSDPDDAPILAKSKQPPPKKRRIVADDDDDEDEESYKPVIKVESKTKAKGKAAVLSSSEEGEDVVPAKKPTPAPKKAPVSVKAIPKPKKVPVEDVKAEEKPKAPSNYSKFLAAQANKAAGPSAPGSKEVPEGKPGCLIGLKLVFTGELQSLAREEAVELAKRYGATVTGSPSGVTSYVVVGENAGPSKLKKIKEKGIATIDEDGFLNLIATRGAGELDEKTKKKLRDEQDKIHKAAREMEAKEAEEAKQRAKAVKAAQKTGTSPAMKLPPPPTSQLWTTKYSPKKLSEICGNKSNVEKLQGWLSNWSKSYQSNFKKPGKDMMGAFRAVLISGPPGIGKTTTAHLVAVACGYTPLELNASDARSKKLIEGGTNIDNTSVDGWMKGTGSTTVSGVAITHKTCLIMDEVDGMSGGDRGGVGAMNALVKKTKIPIILICNDRSTPKMKPLQATTFNMTFRRPPVNEIRSRIMSIGFKEKLKLTSPVVDQLVAGSNSDIRQVLNMLSTWKLANNEISFDDGKELLRMNEKNTILSPFDLCNKLFGPYMFSHTNRQTLTEKMELYFQDFSFVPLFMQDNYPKQNFSRANNLDGHEAALKKLELMDKAAEAISQGDCIDRMIHGPDQQWSLLPCHAVMSTIIPAYHCYGAGGGWGGQYGMSFPAWMGNNSKQQKFNKLLHDIQIHMRLKISGNAGQVRQHYIPALFEKLVAPLQDKNAGSDQIEQIIETMDEYFLNKEHWDAMVELGVGSHKEADVTKKIATSTKTAFTKTYNKSDHPVPFRKEGVFQAAKLAPEPKADNEDVLDDGEGEFVASSEDETEEGDLEEQMKKDKLIRAKKSTKGAAATKKAATSKSKAKK